MQGAVSPSQTANLPDRLVHLDLKGAPPKVAYYEHLFPLLSRWGATGLLIEYEDMFPYTGNLHMLAAHNAYSPSELYHIHYLAKQNNLKVIPLIQTFGHFEFVLKHEEFKPYRELPRYPMALCPLYKDSLMLVTAMLDQVINLHNDITMFHIGADEVFHLGLCEKCQTHLKKHNLTPIELFFKHMARVVNHLQVTYPRLRIIMWDDMFRQASVEVLQKSGIGDLVEPMVWNYNKNLHFPEDMWERYAQVFPYFWAATAFKGATGPWMYVTDIGYHIENHRAWRKLINTLDNDGFRGYALTGWQRYDHYAVLCELLPAAVPSLVMCLFILNKGGFNETTHKKASQELNFDDLLPISPFSCIGKYSECDFPGSQVYRGILVILHLKSQHKQFYSNNERLNGWMTDYHVAHRFCNPAHIEHMLPQAKELLDQAENLKQQMVPVMSTIFYDDAIEEFMTVHLLPIIKELSETVVKAEELLAIGACPKVMPLPPTVEMDEC